MGSVVAFQPREAAGIRKPPSAGATASIVIFPGIRYERREPELSGEKIRDKGRGERTRPKH